MLIAPRGDVTIEALPELGIVIIRAANPEDAKLVAQLIEYITEISKESLIKVELVELKQADGTSVYNILNQLFLMREGVRKVEAMAAIVKELKDEDLTALSEHYAKLEAKRSSEPIDAALAKRGAELAAQRRCGSCHLPSWAGQEQMPRLARQRIDYAIATLKSYRDNPRPGADTAMSANVAGATDADLAALAHYAASL